MEQEVKDIITKIASIQMEAIHRIIDNPNGQEYSDLVKLLEINNDEIVDKAEDLYNFYDGVTKWPSAISLASEYQLLTCTHILFMMEDEWIIDNHMGVYGAWTILHKALSKFHKEFKVFNVYGKQGSNKNPK